MKLSQSVEHDPLYTSKQLVGKSEIILKLVCIAN